jgi:hypothetical protein
MRGSVCLSFLLGVFLFLTVRYSFLVAFGIMYCCGMLVVIGTAFAVRYNHIKRSKSPILDDYPGYLEGQELIA